MPEKDASAQLRAEVKEQEMEPGGDHKDAAKTGYEQLRKAQAR